MTSRWGKSEEMTFKTAMQRLAWAFLWGTQSLSGFKTRNECCHGAIVQTSNFAQSVAKKCSDGLQQSCSLSSCKRCSGLVSPLLAANLCGSHL